MYWYVIADAVLLWDCVIWLPTVLYWPLNEMPGVTWTIMVTESAVIVPVLASLTPWSSKNAPLELMTGVRVTPPLPTCGGLTVSAIVAVCV